MIAIIAPYDFSETTLAALRVADFAAFLGYDVAYLVSGSCRRGVSSVWDQRVRSSRRLTDIYDLKMSRAIVFGLTPSGWLRYLDYMSSGPPRDLVLNWRDAQEGNVANWNLYERVISPSPSLHHAVVNALTVAKKTVLPAMLSWAPGVTGLERAGGEGKLRIACTCDNGTLREHPELWLHVVGEVLSQAPHVSFSLQLTGSLPRAARRLLTQLRQQYATRLDSCGPMEHAANLAWLRRHHLFAYPAARANFGLRPAQARAMGVPPVCSAIEPFEQQVKDGLNGWLVPCQQDNGLLGSRRAVFDAGTWTAKLLHLSRNLSKVDEASAKCDGRDEEFNVFWQNTLSPP